MRNHPCRQVLVSMFMIFSLLFGPLGCGRELERVDQGSSEAQTPSTYDELGLLHNDALAYLAEHGATPDDGITTTRLLQEFLLSRGFQPPPIDYAATQAFARRHFSGTLPDAVSSLHADGHLSSAQRPYVDDLVRNVTSQFLQGASAAQVGAYIRTLESTVAAARGLTSAERDELLQILAITRHSAVYWESNAVSPAGGIDTLGLSAACKKCLKKNWAVIALLDGMGAVAGAASGVPLLSLLAAIIVSFTFAIVLCPSCG